MELGLFDPRLLHHQELNASHYRPFENDAGKFLYTNLPDNKGDILDERNYLKASVRDALIDVGVEEITYERDYGKWTFKGGKTAHFRLTCRLHFQGGRVFSGVVYCSTKDTIDKRQGKKKALKRALGAYIAFDQGALSNGHILLV